MSFFSPAVSVWALLIDCPLLPLPFSHHSHPPPIQPSTQRAREHRYLLYLCCRVLRRRPLLQHWDTSLATYPVDFWSSDSWSCSSCWHQLPPLLLPSSPGTRTVLWREGQSLPREQHGGPPSSRCYEMVYRPWRWSLTPGVVVLKRCERCPEIKKSVNCIVTTKTRLFSLNFPILPWANDLLLLHNYQWP